MTLVVTGMGAWSAAGRGVQPLRSLLHRREHAFSERPPYPHEGLGSPWCGIAPGLERERPAETLLLAVANDALVQAGLTAPLPTMGLVVGTTSGNISGPWERWHRDVLSGKTSSETGCGREAPTLRLAAKLGLTGPDRRLRAGVGVARRRAGPGGTRRRPRCPLAVHPRRVQRAGSTLGGSHPSLPGRPGRPDPGGGSRGPGGRALRARQPPRRESPGSGPRRRVGRGCPSHDGPPP